MEPADRFDALIGDLITVDGVSAPAGGRRLGAQALRYQGRIIAMLAGGCLTVKLPRPRVDELVAERLGVRFETSPGTPLREWFVLAPGGRIPWLDLTKEALAYAQQPGQSGARTSTA
jgi:hypothetical protein